MGYNSHIFGGIYWGGDWEILYIQQDLYLIKTRVGYNSHIFGGIYWAGGIEKFCIYNKTFI